MASAFDTLYQQTVVPMLQQQFGTTCTISRGYSVTRDVVCIRLWKASERDRPEAVGPLKITATPYEFLISDDEYKFDGSACDPQVSDRIEEEFGTFEVLPNKGKADFELRPDGMLRIRTKRIDTE